MKLSLLLLCLLYLASCSENLVDSTKVEEKSSIVEIGNKELITTEFPKRWKTSYYDETEPMNSMDSTCERNFQNLHYFEYLDGKIIPYSDKYKSLVEKDEKLDSLRLYTAFIYKNHRFEYLEVYKKKESKDSEFPIQIKKLEVLRFNKNVPEKQLTVYSEISYPYEPELKIGYLDRKEKLTIKEFEIDESGVNYNGEKKKDCIDFFN